MSNRFNLSQFTVSLSTLTCARDEKPAAYAAFVADSLRDATLDWLIEGSDALTQVLGKFEGAGKTSTAVKFRKVIRASGASLAPYGEISGLSLTKNKFPGGNGDLGRKDHDNRIAVCEQFHAKVYAYACFVFAPAVSDGAVDPLASFGAFSEKSFSIKIASASVEQIESAIKRTLTLTALLASALESCKKQNGSESAPAPVEASAPAPAPVEASAPAPAPVEASAPAPAPVEASAPAPEASAPDESAPEASAPAPAKTRRTISVKRKLVA